MSCPYTDVTIVMGDFNAKVGKEPFTTPSAGKMGLHDTSDSNGLRLLNLAAAHNLKIGGTLFKHKLIHLGTWRSTDGRTVNQIDHILISGKFGSSLMDVRVKRGANAESDHYLVVGKLHQRIANNKETRRRHDHGPSYSVDKLYSKEIRGKYAKVVSAQLKENTNEPTTVEEDIDDVENKWQNCLRAISKAGHEVLGDKPRVEKKPCFNEECERITRIKNTLYRRTLAPNCRRETIRRYKLIKNMEKRVHRKRQREHRHATMDAIQFSNMSPR